MYYWQFSENIKMKIYIIIQVQLKARPNKTGFDVMNFILILLESCLYYYVIHDFSVWLIEPVLTQWISIILEG